MGCARYLRPLIRAGVVLLVAGCATLAPAASAGEAGTGSGGDEQLAFDLKEALFHPVKLWLRDVAKESKNEYGKPTKRGTYSRLPRKIDDDTYVVSAHVDRIDDDRVVTERMELTVKRSGADSWAVSAAEVKDTYVGLFEPRLTDCRDFDRFRFDREGLKLDGSRGTVCAEILNGRPSALWVRAADLKQRYEPPPHAELYPAGQDYIELYKMVSKDHSNQLVFDPELISYSCSAARCEELLGSMFDGLRDASGGGGAGLPDWAQRVADWMDRMRREDPFALFQPEDFNFLGSYRSDDFYSALALRKFDPFKPPFGSLELPGEGIALAVDKHGGFEVQFIVIPRRFDIPEQLAGPVYGYYSEETLANSRPDELERRDDEGRRWHEVESLRGTVEMGLEDPEIIHGDIRFGVNIKRGLQVLPFSIVGYTGQTAMGRDKPPELFVNSVQANGEELTWVRTGPISGMIVLPEPVPAGAHLDLHMDFETKAIRTITYSFMAVARFGWMPFVDFGDFIDEFELTVRSPSKFQVIGIGHMVDQTTEGDVTTTRWVADSPVVFPSMTLGMYKSDTAGKDFEPARKANGTPIDVVVYVDEASASDWDVTTAKLRPLAQQAINSINLYREVSGLDYPYGKLHFVNDPQGFLYGQAPSSLIYLGQGVFRGEAFLAPYFPDAAGIAKFLKSVVSHEVGHQWWGSRISNANNRNYWFVESLAEYFSALYLEAVYGRKEYLEQVDEWRRTVLETNLKSSVQNASALWSGEGGGYQPALYNKGPLAFHVMRSMYGDDKFFPAIKELSLSLAEKREIVTEDLKVAAEAAFGGVAPDGTRYNADLGWFFNQWIRGAAIPQYALNYGVRRAEDGTWIVEGTVKQRLVVGSKSNYNVVDGEYFRGLTTITVTGKDKNDYPVRVVVEGPETPFAFKVPVQPRDVVLNKGNEMLALDVLVNRGF